LPICGEIPEASFGCYFGLFEGVFLAPVNDSCGADTLHNPVEYPGALTRIEQNVCKIIAKDKPGISGLA